MTNLRRRTIGALAAVLVLGTLVSVAPRAGAATPKPVVSYTYDADGRLATVTSSAGTATYHYDKVGNLTSVTRSTGPSRRNGDKNGPTPSPQPVVTAVAPTYARYGQQITVTGHGFSAESSKDSVRIGSLFAPVVSASPGALTVTAPPGSGGRVVVQTTG